MAAETARIDYARINGCAYWLDMQPNTTDRSERCP
jgi:hypothetical protein